jgi:hypothetical protein
MSDFHTSNERAPLTAFHACGTSSRMFTYAWFQQSLSAAQLDLITGEDISTTKFRKSLKNEITVLEKGKLGHENV